MEERKTTRHVVCAYPCYDAVDDIDPYRQKILEKYKNVTREKETL